MADVEVQVEGFPWDRDKWLEVAARADDIGNRVMKHFEGDSGHLFWKAAQTLQELIPIIDHINATGHYCRWPEECTDAEHPTS